MDTDALGGAMIDGCEDGQRAVFDRVGLRGISAPHLKRGFRYDGALMGVSRRRIRLTRRGQQLMLAQQTQHPILRGADALMS